MGTERGADRLAAFNDAIAAIAITLLVLPLTDKASAIGNQSVGAFLADNSSALLAFIISWLVIAAFWRDQHTLLEGLRGYTVGLRNAMLLWMLAIVFIPFPTELVSAAERGSAGAHAIYVATLLVASLALLIERRIILAHPRIIDPDAVDVYREPQSGAATVLLVIVLVLVVAVPAPGLWWLLLLTLQAPMAKLLERLFSD